MKEFIKTNAKKIFIRFPQLRRFVAKLNRLANGGSGDTISGIKIKPEERNIFTKNALYAGYSVEYLNAKALTKNERACELKKIFYNKVGYYLDLDNPKTFNQKIQWLKLNYSNSSMPRCVDKAEFKNYIDEKLGEGYTVPSYGSYESENDIDFDALPNKFVLKSNVQSDARHILLVTDKSKLDVDKAKTVMATWLLKKNNLCSSYCSAYWGVQPKIVVEKFLESESGSVNDYKFYCYNGKCKHFLVCKDRQTKTKYINYDRDFNCIKPSPKSYFEEGKCEDIETINKMIEIAEKLAIPFPFVRVDFYDIDGKLYVGELTFYPGGGYNSYSEEWDKKFGDYLKLPEATDNFLLSRLANVIGAKIPKELYKVKYKRVLTQYQYIQTGDVIISAGWYDSETVITEALKRKAVAIFCSEKDKKKFPQTNVISVANPLECVQKYEIWKRSFFDVKCIAITGSVGKTTTTGLINSVFKSSFSTLTGHSMANSHGAILRNIQKLTSDYEWWVQEVGGVQPGYIESSAVVLKPDIVVLTNIGESHLNTYHTRKNIFLDKSSLERYAKNNGIVIINYDDDILKNADYSHSIVTCSISNSEANYYAKSIITDYNGIHFLVVCNLTGETISVNLKLYGEYNVLNALFAIAAGKIAGIDLENIVGAIEKYTPSGMRQNFINIGGYNLMIDVFNAEPKTVLGSAVTLVQMPKPKGKKIFITGHIDKLGDKSPMLHEKLGHEISKLDIDIIVLYAGDSKYIYKGLLDEGNKNVLLMETREELENWMKLNISRDDLVFFKSGQFEAALAKSIDRVFGTTFQNEQQFNEGEVVIDKNGYKIRLRKDDIAELEGYVGNETDLILPNYYNGIPIIRIRPFAFYKNKSIKSVVIPDTVVNIGAEAFYQCINITNVTLSKNLKIIGKNVFNYNRKLKNITIPEGVIHIDRHAFFDCISLENVEIPSSVGFLGESVFGVSKGLKNSKLKIKFSTNEYIKKYLDENSMNYEMI